MNIAIYARFSSSSQREASIEEQMQACEEYAIRNKHSIVKKYSDSAMTGRNDNRPDFQRLLADSSKRIFQGVLVYSIDRFGRNMRQSIENIAKLEDNGVEILSAMEKFTTDASGKFFRNLMMAQAQFSSDFSAEKIQRGMDYNGERCLSTGGNIALGYKVNKESKRFEINPDTAPIVKTIFEMYADGKTVTEITTHLNSLGCKTARGVPFNKNSLHTMLKNKRYLGVYTYKGTEIPDGMPRIISDELFEKVAEIMAKNKKAPARARAKVEYLLTTKLFCGHCKEMMTGFSGTAKQGRVYNYYICNGRKKKKCDKKMVRKDYIEDLVVSQCRKLLSTTNISKISKEVAAICAAERETSNLRYLKKCLSNNERKSKNTMNAVTETDDSEIRADLYEELKQLRSEHKELERQIAKEEVILPDLTEPKIKFFLTSLKRGNANDIKYRKALISIFVNRIFLYDDRVTITFNSGDEPVTINDILLSEIEDRDRQIKNLFMTGVGPPKQHNPNLFPIGDGFGFVVYLDSIRA